MSQHDLSITAADANTGVSFRGQVNAALQALGSNQAGTGEPPLIYPCQLWADLTTNFLKIRNTANNAWHTFLPLNASLFNSSGDMTISGNISATKTGASITFALTGDTNAYILLKHAGAGADVKYMQIIDASGYTSFRSLTDAGAVNRNSLVIEHATGKVGIGGSPSQKIDVMESEVGTALYSLVRHMDNTNAGSHVYQFLQSGGSGGGDAATLYVVAGVQGWAAGVDNSDSDSFKISTGTALGTNDRLIITTGGLIGLGSPSPHASAKVTIFGYLAGADVETDSAQKTFWICGRHYTNSEELAALIGITAGSGANLINIGGSTSAWNAATQISFYTAANSTTLTGTERLRVCSDGRINFGGGGGSAAFLNYFIGSLTAASGSAIGLSNRVTLAAAANSDQFTAMEVNPTFAKGAYTGITTWCLLIQNPSVSGGGTIANHYQLYIATPSIGTTNHAIYVAGGDTYLGGKFGCNGAAPQAPYASGGAAPAGGTGTTAGAYDTAAHRDALITLVNNMRTALINVGVMS